MSGINLLTDTNIILYLLGGDRDIAGILSGRIVHLSFINELELLSFPQLSSEDAQIIREFLRETIIIDINESIKAHTIYMRTKYNLKLPDAIVAATARFLQIPLLTADRDFKQIMEIPILFYEK